MEAVGCPEKLVPIFHMPENFCLYCQSSPVINTKSFNHRAGWNRHAALNLNQAGYWFESWSRDQKYWLRIFVDFLSPFSRDGFLICDSL
jgi:hypothetical protein